MLPKDFENLLAETMKARSLAMEAFEKKYSNISDDDVIDMRTLKIVKKKGRPKKKKTRKMGKNSVKQGNEMKSNLYEKQPQLKHYSAHSQKQVMINKVVKLGELNSYALSDKGKMYVRNIKKYLRSKGPMKEDSTLFFESKELATKKSKNSTETVNNCGNDETPNSCSSDVNDGDANYCSSDEATSDSATDEDANNYVIDDDAIYSSSNATANNCASNDIANCANDKDANYCSSEDVTKDCANKDALYNIESQNETLPLNCKKNVCRHSPLNRYSPDKAKLDFLTYNPFNVNGSEKKYKFSFKLDILHKKINECSLTNDSVATPEMYSKSSGTKYVDLNSKHTDLEKVFNGKHPIKKMFSVSENNISKIGKHSIAKISSSLANKNINKQRRKGKLQRKIKKDVKTASNCNLDALHKEVSICCLTNDSISTPEKNSKSSGTKYANSRSKCLASQYFCSDIHPFQKNLFNVNEDKLSKTATNNDVEIDNTFPIKDICTPQAKEMPRQIFTFSELVDKKQTQQNKTPNAYFTEKPSCDTANTDSVESLSAINDLSISRQGMLHCKSRKILTSSKPSSETLKHTNKFNFTKPSNRKLEDQNDTSDISFTERFSIEKLNPEKVLTVTKLSGKMQNHLNETPNIHLSRKPSSLKCEPRNIFSETKPPNRELADQNETSRSNFRLQNHLNETPNIHLSRKPSSLKCEPRNIFTETKPPNRELADQNETSRSNFRLQNHLNETPNIHLSRKPSSLKCEPRNIFSETKPLNRELADQNETSSLNFTEESSSEKLTPKKGLINTKPSDKKQNRWNEKHNTFLTGKSSCDAEKTNSSASLSEVNELPIYKESILQNSVEKLIPKNINKYPLVKNKKRFTSSKLSGNTPGHQNKTDLYLLKKSSRDIEETSINSLLPSIEHLTISSQSSLQDSGVASSYSLRSKKHPPSNPMPKDENKPITCDLENRSQNTFNTSELKKCYVRLEKITIQNFDPDYRKPARGVPSAKSKDNNNCLKKYIYKSTSKQYSTSKCATAKNHLSEGHFKSEKKDTFIDMCHNFPNKDFYTPEAVKKQPSNKSYFNTCPAKSTFNLNTLPVKFDSLTTASYSKRSSPILALEYPGIFRNASVIVHNDRYPKRIHKRRPSVYNFPIDCLSLL